MSAAAERWDRWLYRLLTAAWLVCFGAGGALILYGMAIEYRQCATAASSITFGSIVAILNYIVRVPVFGGAFVIFLYGLLPVRDATPDNRAATLAAAVRRQAPFASLMILALALLGPIRDLSEFDLFDQQFGEAFFKDRLHLTDWFGATTLGIVAAVAFIALGAKRWKPSSASDTAVVEASARAKRLVACLAVVVIALVVTWPSRYFAQDRHFEHLAVISFVWELGLVAILVLTDDPFRSWRRPGAWLMRNIEAIRLLVLLDLMRVLARQDWYYELTWLQGRCEHTPVSLVFFAGRLHNLTQLAMFTPPLVIALGALAWRFGRPGRDHA